MSTLQLFDVEFQFKKAAAAPSQGQTGPADAYRRERRRVVVAAASAHSKDILAVLNADVTILSGETIDILSVRSVATPGSEGNTVLS
jgi:hypothetical protein